MAWSACWCTLWRSRWLPVTRSTSSPTPTCHRCPTASSCIAGRSTGAAPCRSCVPFASSDRRSATSALTWSTCTRSSPVSSAGCPLGGSGTRRTAVVYQPHAWSDQLSDRRWVNGGVRASERLSARATDLIVANGPDELTRGRAGRRTRAGRGRSASPSTSTFFRPPTQEEQAGSQCRARPRRGTRRPDPGPADPAEGPGPAAARMGARSTPTTRSWRWSGPVTPRLSALWRLRSGDGR